MKEPAQKKAWSEADDDEDVAAFTAAMELDHQQVEKAIDETAGDFSDDDAPPQVVPKNRFGLPVAIRKKTALELRFEQLDKEREEAKEKAEQDKAEQMTLIADAQAENEDSLARIVGQIEALQATVLSQQEESNRKFTEMQIDSNRKFADMQTAMERSNAMTMGFFQKFEQQYKHQQQQLQQPVHGKGSCKAGAPQQKREVNVEEADLDEDGHPKKLKVPFDSIAGTAAAASASC
jgi:hypothetical protein